jgi:hypothetical protein
MTNSMNRLIFLKKLIDKRIDKISKIKHFFSVYLHVHSYWRDRLFNQDHINNKNYQFCIVDVEKNKKKKWEK